GAAPGTALLEPREHQVGDNRRFDRAPAGGDDVLDERRQVRRALGGRGAYLPAIIQSINSAGWYAPRRPNALRASTIWLTPVRWPISTNRPNTDMPMTLPTTSTSTVSARLKPSVMPSAPSTQLIGAMFAPAQIQNWCIAVDTR